MKQSIKQVFSLILTLFLVYSLVVSALKPAGAIQDKPPASSAPEETVSVQTDGINNELDKLILAEMSKSNIVGISAAFVKDGRVVWSNGYGLADLQNKTPAGSDTIYRIASISKSIGATALLQLWEQGRFGLDDDIGSYLGYPVRNPQYPAEPVTFRMLLTHTSSIQDGSSQGGYLKALSSSSPPLLKELLVPGSEAYSSLTWGSYRPGTAFEYSNLGSGIIACLVEKISGERFDTYCLNHIFKPLGLDASYDAADILNRDRIAVLYRPSGDGQNFVPSYDNYRDGEVPPRGFKMPLGNNYIGPAGGVRSSALDLARFMIAHMNGGEYEDVRILKRETVDLMHQMHWFGYGFDGFYRQKGLNFHITDSLAGRRLTGHAGQSYGLVSDMYFDRDENTGVIFITNGGYYSYLVNGFTSIEHSVINHIFNQLAGPSQPTTREIQFLGEENKLIINGREIILPVAAEKQGDYVYIPAVSLADALEAQIEFKQADTLTLTREGTAVSARLSDPNLYVNGQIVTLESHPYLKTGIFMIPLRIVSESLGAEVVYNADKNTTSITI